MLTPVTAAFVRTLPLYKLGGGVSERERETDRDTDREGRREGGERGGERERE